MGDSGFYSETAAKSCLVMYRMGGLRHVLLYLHDFLRGRLPVVRINTIYCDKDARYIVNMADTSTVLNDDAASDTSAEKYTSADSEDAPAEDGGEDSADSESAAE